MAHPSAPDSGDLPVTTDVLRRLADAARMVTLPLHGRTVATHDKRTRGVFDPVTEADRGAERAIRDMIEAHHPDHGIVGEEFGGTREDARFVWSLDPIDGTRAFLCGLPSWTTLIALLDGGVPALGLIDAPVLDEQYVGDGRETRLVGRGRDEMLRVSGCGELGEARLATTDPYLFKGVEAEGFARVRHAARVARYGLDAYAYARLAAGCVDLVVEAGLQPYDYHALIPVVRGAGGVVGDWRGGNDFAQGRVVAAASQRLYDQALELLSASG